MKSTEWSTKHWLKANNKRTYTFITDIKQNKDNGSIFLDIKF